MKVSEETKKQVDFIDYCKDCFPDLLVLHIPNQGKRSKRYGYELKKMGLRKGVPDIFIPIKNLWIEFKSRKGITKKEQIAMHKELESAGHRVFICRNTEQAATILDIFLDGAFGKYRDWVSKKEEIPNNEKSSNHQMMTHTHNLVSVADEDLLF